MTGGRETDLAALRAAPRDRISSFPPPAREAGSAEGSISKLVDGCQGLVRSLAWKIHRKLPPSVDLEDLVGFGELGLLEAARAFDPSRGGKFITYAYYRIRGAIFDGLSKMAWFSRYDYHSSRYERLAGEVLRLEASDGNGTGASSLEEDVSWLKSAAGALAVVYLATGIDSEGNPKEVGLVDDSSPPPPEAAMEAELREKLRRLIDALPPDAGSLIRGVYYDGLTLEEAGSRLGISKAWASRLHAKTLDRLARSLRLIGYAE